MPAKNTHAVPQWKRNAFGAAVMLVLFGMANTSSGDTTYGSSGVPPTVANTPAAGNVPRDALTSDPKRNSVVFKKKGRTVKTIPDCAGKEPCDAKNYVFRSKRPDENNVGVGVSANNNRQSAKVRAKVPF